MKNDTFIALGTVIGNFMLVQVGSGRGMLINIPTGNRLDDVTVDLTHQGGLFTGMYGTTYGELLRVYGGYNIGNEINVLAITNAGTIPRQSETPQPKAKPDVVKFVRYIRPRDVDGVIYNMYGVTILFTLDYKLENIKFQYSICRGDNFNKKKGVEIAETRAVYVIPMPTGGIAEKGVTDYVLGKLARGEIKYIPQVEADYMISMYEAV